ncbi:MAG: TraR/DksA family transcriptional regulator [Acidobacteriota bacterium]
MAETLTPSQHLSATELKSLEQALIAKRLEVSKLYRQDVEAGKEASDDNADDFADRANNSYNRETNFALSDGERQLLIAIDAALLRMEQGTYGVCQNCGQLIGVERLRAVPWAQYCIECQELHESGLLDN